MNRNNKIILILLVGAFLGIFISEYMYDRDFDGVPNDSDDFPDNANEWKDSDQDGIGDNEDLDDDNDGLNNTKDYFTNNLALKIKKKYGKAKIITETNVFAHMEEVLTLLKSIKNLMKKDGIFISESHYLYDLIQYNQYDTIYHEHLRYYSLSSLKFLFNKVGLEIIRAKIDLIVTSDKSIIKVFYKIEMK